MNPEQPSTSVSIPTSAGCQRNVPSHPALIQFIGKRMTWSFAWSLLHYLVLRANPECRDPKTEPVQELALYFPAAKVTILGWRLDLLLEPIASQSIACVRLSKTESAAPDGNTAVISDLFILPADYDVLAECLEAEAAATSQEEHE